MSSFLICEVSAVCGFSGRLQPAQPRLFWWWMFPRKLKQWEDPEHIFRSLFVESPWNCLLKSWYLKCPSHFIFLGSPSPPPFFCSYWHISLFPRRKSYKRGNNSLNLSSSLYFCCSTGQITYLVLTIVCHNCRVSSPGLTLGVGTKVVLGVVPKQRWASRLRHIGRMPLQPGGVSWGI